MFWKLIPLRAVWAPLLLLLVGLSVCGKVKRQTDDDSAISPTSAFVEPSSRLSELISPLTARPVDLVFILDGTQSVRAKRFQQFVKAFAADFSSLFQLSSNRTRVAVVVFAACQKVRTEVDFISDASISLDDENDFSKCTLLQALNSLEFIGGQGSCLGKGLVKAEKILMSARSDTRRLVILLTDGRPRGDDSPTEVAQRMRNIETTIVAFGIGKGAPENQLVAIATQGHMYTLEKWEDLQPLTTAVNKEMTGNLNLRPEVPLQYVQDAHCSSLCPTANDRACCDVLERCACITETGKFGCVCQQGYNGNGMNGNCTAVSVPVQLTCPSDMVIPTDHRRPTAIASWTIPVNDPSRGVTITSTPNPPVLLSVGTTQVRYTAIDEESLTKAECSFTIEVMDTEPPILLSCPEDLIETTTTQTLHVSWDAPRFQDNTGKVSIATNSQADAVLAMLDAHTEVWYQATDDAGHSAYCNFTVALKPHQCPYTEPTLNGALLCENWIEGGTVCALSCQEGYDFNRFPAALYMCSESSESVGTREWQVLDINTATLQIMENPWPQCYKSSGSVRTPSRKSIRYYDRPCSSAESQSKLRRKFLRLFRKLDKEVPGFCRDDCEEGGVLVACGPQNDENTDGNTERLKRDIDKQDILGLLAKNSIQSLKSSIPSDVLISRLHEILLKDLDNSIKTSLVPYFETAIGASPQPVLICEEGQVQKGSVCLECPIGTYHTPAVNKCIACDYGTFQDEAGEMSCETCPAGTNTTDAGARKANQCREPCRAGTISPTGLQPCVACPNGTFAATEGSRSCQQCPDGMTTDNVGAQSAEECLSDVCEPGSFSMSGHQPCLPCAPGLYQPMRGQHACLPCPDGSSSQALGASHVTSCVAFVTCDEKICQNNGTCVVRADVDVFCKCVTGFTGTSCETDIDDCLEEGLCMHGGTCRDSVAGYRCVCLPGFNGTNCEEDVDECKSGPCVHAHACNDEINSYHCECREGYSGTDCDINIDECASSPCRNGATCLDQVAAFNCSCLPGYEGTFCEVRINHCINHSCVNNGTCQTIDTGPHCTCAVGFTGEFCQDDVNDCLLSPCKNNSTCVDGVDSYSCKCSKGYTGTNCELLIDYCTPNLCQNEGTCISQLQGFRCNCKTRYKGIRCEISTIRRCSNTTCQNGGICVNLFHGPWCNCKPGFTGNNCETDVDDCVGVTCFNGGRCLDQVGAYSCECQPGFNGTLCNLTIDECKSVPCMNGATCLDGMNAFTCICTSGFSGILCEDRLDLCSPNPCQNDALCINNLDEYRCVCQEGFTGQDCEVNIDDCVMAFCDNGGTCIDDVGGYWCKCAVGFTGSDCEINVDDCRGVFCENSGRCIDGVNEARCKCAQGFTGERCETNVDDCVGVRCSDQGYCVDDVDGFHCQCAIGFSGEFCQTNIQDCDNDTCQNNGTCLDGVNAFHCVCVEGFTGNHCQVDIDDCAGSPCMNGGQCIDNINSYTCLCTRDFTGTHCELVIDNCMHTPCGNGGSCIDDIDIFHCDCVPGITGLLCEFNIDDCWSRPCINKGTCEDGINNYRCHCLQGYTGGNCELMVDNCAISTDACLNGATCVNRITSYTCECVEGYSGANCQNKMNYCEPPPCLNNGVCQDLEMGFKCLCPRGYQGKSCEIREDPCLGYICLNRALCQDSPNGPACVCLPGFTGKQCEENIDNCIDMPCQNGGSCEDRLNGYECACIDGFIGINCQIDIDECRSAPCENGATCMDKVNEYRCLCMDGFTGGNCGINIDDCSSNPCRNRGSCVDGINDFKCQCESGFTGDVCDVNIDDCLGMQCRNGGTCIDYVEGFFCLCSPRFTGTLCDVDIDNCVGVECTNGGTCKDGANEYHCQCVDGFTGSRCEIDIDDCLGQPCLNDAGCVDAVNAFICECPRGFSGVLCGIDVDECQSSPCLNQAQCMDGVDSYSCICEEGFEGVQCEHNIDDCQDHPCQNNGTCEDLINSFICQCPVGFSGTLCQMNVNECASSPCKNGGHCVDGVNTFTCLCPRGFIGNLCQVDIDDCATSSCQNGGKCVDGIDTYSCTCAVGFTGNLCETNIDDCQLNPCDEHGGQCIDGINNFTCQCFPGFTGIHCELSVDDCYSQPCQNDARCVDRDGDYCCDCIPGFTGKNCEIDINECASAPCLNDGICYDDINSYMCECQDGFTGVMCEVNFDDCASDPCLNGAECQDLPRGFSCYCQSGYRGHRCQERMNPCDAHPCLNNGLCTQESNSKGFRCECPHGYRGDFCEEDIDDCLGHMEECLNGAVCEDRVDGFFCQCAPGYAGEKCQLKLSLDFDLIFTLRQPTPNRIHVQPDLYELTMSLWVRPEDMTIQKGSLVSYIVYREDNHLTAVDQGSMAVALSLRDYSNMVVQINDEVVEINFRPERESAWHHIAFTWESESGDWYFYYDGMLERQGTGLQAGGHIPGGGLLTIGMEHDGIAQEPLNNFVGRLSQVNMWQYAMSGAEILSLYGSCGSMGDAMAWPQVLQNGRMVQRRQPSQICRNIDDCASSPCLNGATCHDSLHSYTCDCPDGYEGNECQIVSASCMQDMCLNGGRCYDRTTGPVCRCARGFTGPRCEVAVNPCESLQCNYGGTCVVQDVTKAVCRCPPGFRGPQCNYDKNECSIGISGCSQQCINTLGSYYCDCKTGFTLQLDGKMCVDARLCRQNDVIRQANEEWQENCQHCRCVEGIATCTPMTCYNPICPKGQEAVRAPGYCCPVCSVEKDFCAVDALGNFESFDLYKFYFHGDCRYTMAQDCSSGSFSIHIESEQKGSVETSRSEAFKKAVFIYLNGDKIELSSTGVKVNGKLVNLPFLSVQHGVIQIDHLQDKDVKVSTNTGLEVLWSASGKVKVSVPRLFRRRLCGMCGNYNGKRKDDKLTKQQLPSRSASEFIHSWKVNGYEHCSLPATLPGPVSLPGSVSLPRLLVNRLPACTGLTYHSWRGVLAKCDILKQDVFAECRKVVNPRSFYWLCQQDVCSCGSNEPCYCEAIAAYAQECRRNGIVVRDWRNTTICGIDCPETMLFDDCSPPCIETCYNTASLIEMCRRLPCVARCQCAAGFAFHEQRCILKSTCPNLVQSKGG